VLGFKSFSRSHHAVIRAYDEAGGVIEKHEHAADQKQTRSSTPGQTNKMTNVLKNVTAIVILTIIGKESSVVVFIADCWKEESPIIFCF